jgi:hypothetical protein
MGMILLSGAIAPFVSLRVEADLAEGLGAFFSFQDKVL